MDQPRGDGVGGRQVVQGAQVDNPGLCLAFQLPNKIPKAIIANSG